MAQPEKRENSVLFSLRELRQIEESRVEEEESKVKNAEAAKLRAKQDEERRIRDEIEGKERAAADEVRRIKELELAREHEARIRVESTEAAERARHQAALEKERLEQEMALRRAEVAKKRPTWMLAVMFTAIAGLAGGIAFAIHKMGQSDADKAMAAAADVDRINAEKESKASAERVEKLEKEAAEMAAKVDIAIDNVAKAKDAADLAVAQGKLQALRKEQAEQASRVAAAKAAAEKAKRMGGLKISQKCIDNPLAKGC
jgi:hypothetical protein